jgi:hypothetical protein
MAGLLDIHRDIDIDINDAHNMGLVDTKDIPPFSNLFMVNFVKKKSKYLDIIFFFYILDDCLCVIG